MKDKKKLHLIIAAAIVTTTLATNDVLLPLLPALPIPDARPTPEYVPKPTCQTPNVTHTGYNTTQQPGNILLCQPTPTPTQPTNIVRTTTSTVVKTTTTEVRTVTTTTTTTIEATTTSTNTTVPMDKPCVVFEEGTQYNWWQVLLESGGKPGTFKGTGNPENKDSPPINPCVRPLESQRPEIYAYKHEDSDGETYNRTEIGYPRFYGTPHAFLDVRGDIIWKPPVRANDERIYLVHYILDDIGFWVKASTYCTAKHCRINAPFGRNATMF